MKNIYLVMQYVNNNKLKKFIHKKKNLKIWV
jgi:hypothetical protein